ncbi:1-acyl-sn-glycerol-3-phosphate acyltransferase [Mangrovimicrobium sediminis]|uniref:1-acyl-sn-glycerol-3-phosphate acyltransferase n=1 Tax=Mangrovimicrobium sediminis TaxID=2562682 RepID=A0A4Z0LVZ0_9GAMM|nr:lysophospholipid acyltransferase family protein [Haliea sp. SAOS-164]TGD71420.1 1-acyl-sn-glycerol-3-phosphate acyltransferase [Haliea sp. SAOS-164]
MRIIRSVLVFIWLVLTLIPLGLGLVIASLFVDDEKLWWWFAVPWVRGVIGAARIVGGVKYRVQGFENLPPSADMRRLVLCAKHQSAWETLFLPGMTPHPCSYVFKQELLRIPVFGWALGRLNMVHIDRSQRKKAWTKVAEQGKKLMDRGRWIVIFPEGTRTERGKPGEYKTGGSRLAIATDADVVPIAITSGRCWPRRSFFLVPGTIDVSIGEPISSAGREQGELMEEIGNWIEAEMRRLDPEAYSAPATAPVGG